MADANSGSTHWSKQKEKAAGYWHLKFVLVLFRVFPVIIIRIISFAVGFFYFVFSKNARAESGRFLEKAAPFIDDPKTAKKCRSRFRTLRHIISFSLTLIEKLQVWSGKFSFNKIHFSDDDSGDLIERLDSGKGAFIITSHLGNTELLRGLINLNRTGVSREVPVTAVIDLNVSAHFTRMLKELNPKSGFNIISAKEIGPGTAILLEEKLANGEIVTIAGDRTSAGNAEKNILIPFLGEEAPFSPGIFYLSVLMNNPVYFIFALRRGDLSIKPEYDMYVNKCPLSFECTKKERLGKSSELARYFARLLESYLKKQPFQWYNFFNFWSKEA